MRAPCKPFLTLALLVTPAASYAIKVPVPIDGMTLNVSVQLQTQLLANENGNASGSAAHFLPALPAARPRST